MGEWRAVWDPYIGQSELSTLSRPDPEVIYVKAPRVTRTHGIHTGPRRTQPFCSAMATVGVAGRTDRGGRGLYFAVVAAAPERRIVGKAAWSAG